MTAPAQIIPIRPGQPIPSAVDHPRPAGRVLRGLEIKRAGRFPGINGSRP